MASDGPDSRSDEEGYSISGWDYSALKNLSKISSDVRGHLTVVYLILVLARVVSAGGVFLHLLCNLGGLLTVIGCTVSIVWLLTMDPCCYDEYNEEKRVALLMAAALCEGASLGPLVNLVINIDSTIIGTALVGMSLAFACFLAAAILDGRREFMFLGAFLGSAVTILMWLNFASAFFGGSTAIFKFEIYFGLLLFLGYIIFETQLIIERANSGDHDILRHSLDLSIDFVAYFFRVLVIRTKNAAAKFEKNRGRD